MTTFNFIQTYLQDTVCLNVIIRTFFLSFYWISSYLLLCFSTFLMIFSFISKFSDFFGNKWNQFYWFNCFFYSAVLVVFLLLFLHKCWVVLYLINHSEINLFDWLLHIFISSLFLKSFKYSSTNLSYLYFRYLNFLKVGPKLLKWLPGKKASDLRTWLTVYGYWSEGTYSFFCIF